MFSIVLMPRNLGEILIWSSGHLVIWPSGHLAIWRPDSGHSQLARRQTSRPIFSSFTNLFAGSNYCSVFQVMRGKMQSGSPTHTTKSVGEPDFKHNAPGIAWRTGLCILCIFQISLGPVSQDGSTRYMMTSRWFHRISRWWL